MTTPRSVRLTAITVVKETRPTVHRNLQGGHRGEFLVCVRVFWRVCFGCARAFGSVYVLAVCVRQARAAFGVTHVHVRMHARAGMRRREDLNLSSS